jgi:arylsulfatase A-like enzyme
VSAPAVEREIPGTRLFFTSPRGGIRLDRSFARWRLGFHPSKTAARFSRKAFGPSRAAPELNTGMRMAISFCSKACGSGRAVSVTMPLMKFPIGLCLACALSVWAPSAPAEEVSRPNIVFILADDLGWSDIHVYGSAAHLTPNLDALARGGLRFTNAYAASPVCSPTRASILSGKYPARNNLTDWLGSFSGARAAKQLELKEVTIAEALEQAGYATGLVGKWHLGGPRGAPRMQGFDVVVGTSPRGVSGNSYYLPNQVDLPRARNGEYQTDHLTYEGLRFIEANKERPFFLFQSYYAVHEPIEGRRDLVAKHRARKRKLGIPLNPHYAAMVESLDQGVGRIVAKLEDLGLSERTVVFFFSDNGGFSHKRGEKNGVMSNEPLRMGKGHLYEGGIRAPLIVWNPPLIRSGGVSAVPVVSTDYYPTMLELAGIEPIPEQHTDGVSIVPLLEDPSAELDRQAIYFHYPHRNAQGGVPSGAVRMGNLKLIEFFDDGRLELYDLENDDGESRNLSGAMPEKAKQLRRMLVDWRRSVDAKMPR